MNLGFFKDLFPTKLTFFIFVTYMALFINHGLLITATKSGKHSYDYDPNIIVLITEYVKLLASILIYVKKQSFHSLWIQCLTHRDVLLKYFIPAFLYCLYNNLQFSNLAHYDPTTYFVLLQFRVVVTGLIYQILFNRKLTKTQWISLCILTAGCLIKQAKPPVSNIEPNHINTNSVSLFTFLSTIFAHLGHILRFDSGIIFVLIQILCSCFAGVYNELLLKNKTNTSYNKCSTYPLGQNHKKIGDDDFNAQRSVLLNGVKSSDTYLDNSLTNGQVSNTLNQILIHDSHSCLSASETDEKSDKTKLLNGAHNQNDITNTDDVSTETPIMIQNVFMYLDSIICNYLYFVVFRLFFTRAGDSFNSNDRASAILAYPSRELILPTGNNINSTFISPDLFLNTNNISTQHTSSSYSKTDATNIINPVAILHMFSNDFRLFFVVLNGAAIGLVTSFFLKYLNSILKNFASALEIIFTAILAKLILGIPAGGIYTFVATILVFYSVWLYSRNPVKTST